MNTKSPSRLCEKASRFLDVKINVQETGGFCSICIYRIKRWLCSGPAKHEKLQYATAPEKNPYFSKYTTAPEKNPNSTPDTDRLCGYRRGLVVRGSAGGDARAWRGGGVGSAGSGCRVQCLHCAFIAECYQCGRVVFSLTPG